MDEYSGAHIILYTEDERILLCKRDNRAPNFPGYWSLFGGGTEAKDAGDPRRTACRELSEELEGLELKPVYLEPLCRVRSVRGSGLRIVHYFKARLTCELSELRVKDEGDALGLFVSAELDHLPVRPWDRLAIYKYFQGCEFGYLT